MIFRRFFSSSASPIAARSIIAPLRLSDKKSDLLIELLPANRCIGFSILKKSTPGSPIESKKSMVNFSDYEALENILKAKSNGSLSGSAPVSFDFTDKGCSVIVGQSSDCFSVMLTDPQLYLLKFLLESSWHFTIDTTSN